MSVFREEKSCRDECVHIYLHVNLHPVPPCAQICEGEICPNLTCENARHGNIYLAEMYRIHSLTEIEFLQLKLTPKAPSSKNEAIAKEKGIKLQFEHHISTDHNFGTFNYLAFQHLIYQMDQVH